MWGEGAVAISRERWGLQVVFNKILLSLICHNLEVLSGAYKCAEILIKDVLPSANVIFFCPWVLKRPL